jgi:GntR family transcriptional regulator
MTKTSDRDLRAKTSLLRLVPTLSADKGARGVTRSDRRSVPQSANLALYEQVYAFLARRISSGAWRPAVLPNERDLALEMGVSRGTMRKALDKLEADQIVVRRQGRGTVVGARTQEALAARFGNIVDAQGRRIAEPEITVLAREVGRATDIERAYLDLDDGEKVLRTRRVHNRQGRAYLYEETCLAIDRLPGLRADEVAGDYLIAPLAHRCGMRLARAVEKIAVAEPTSDVVELLAAASGAMLLTLDRLVFSLVDEPVEWRKAVCNLSEECYVVEMI